MPILSQRTAPDEAPPAAARPEGEADAVLARLREHLARGDFVDGDRVRPEREIAAALGVGRRALRRALDVLAGEGRLWRRQGQGTFLCAPPAPRTRGRLELASRTSPAEIMEVRLEIEPVLARYAALRATPLELEHLHRLVERCHDSGSESEFETWDGAFHRKIAEAARNGLFLALFDTVSALRADPDWMRLRESRRHASVRRQLAAEHHAIAAALARRDPEGAQAAMRRHLLAVGETMLAQPLG